MDRLTKNIIAIILLACAVVILAGVVFTPLVLAVKISLYWLFLYLLYFIVIVAVVLWLAVKFNYIDEPKATQGKSKK